MKKTKVNTILCVTVLTLCSLFGLSFADEKSTDNESTSKAVRQAIYVDKDGKVGIGIKVPMRELHLSDENAPPHFVIGVNPISGGYTALDISLSAMFKGYAQLQAIKSSGSDYGNLILNPDGGSVGIGVNDPDVPLVVGGVVSPAIRLTSTDGSTGFLQTLHDHAGVRLFDGKDYAMYWKDGKVGIGTANPGEKLDIGGILKIGNTQIHDNQINRYNNDNLYIGYRNTKNTILQANGGSVGIGVNDPDVPLVVGGVVSPAIRLTSTDGSTGFLQTLHEHGGVRLFDGKDYTMYWKDGKVGIGTANPGEKLDISGILKIGNTQIHDNQINRYNNDNLYIGYRNTKNTILQANGGSVGIGVNDPDVPLVVGGVKSPAIRLTSTDGSTGFLQTLHEHAGVRLFDGKDYTMYWKDGKVGIGTPGPESKLEVNGDIKVRQSAWLNGVTYFGETGLASIEGGLFGFAAVGDNTPFFLSTKNKHRMWITPDGSVGIGVNDPDVPLVVGGVVSPAIRLTSTDGSTGFIQTLHEHAGVRLFDGKDYTMYWKDGKVGIGTPGPESKLEVNGDIKVRQSAWLNGVTYFGETGLASIEGGLFGLAAVGDNTPFFLSTKNKHRMWITPNGNVGIGVNDPDVSLVVGGVVSPAIRLTSTDGSTGFIQTLHEHAGVRLFDGKDYTMYWKDGNVGIGMTDPEYKLDVKGDLRVHNNLVLGDTTVSFSSMRPKNLSKSINLQKIVPDYGMEISGPGFHLLRLTNTLGGGSSWDFAIGDESLHPGLFSIGYCGDPNPLMGGAHHHPVLVLKTDGKVGIGTTSPKCTLSVGDSDTPAWISPGGDNNHLTLATTGGGGKLRFCTKGGSTGNLATGESMRIDTNGNVGIGTTNPWSAKLVIDKGSESRGGILDLNSDNPTINHVIKFSEKGKPKWELIHCGSAKNNHENDFIFRSYPHNIYSPSYSYDVVTFKQDGKVGIGTTLPQHELDVQGTIRAGQYACISDLRYKKNISPIKDALSKVVVLEGVYYNWRTDRYKKKNFSKEKQIGFIAQDVEKIIPEVVYTDSSGYKSISYSKLASVLVEAVKELYDRNNKKITALENENMTLKAKIQSLETRLASFENINKRIAVLEETLKIKSGGKR